MTKWLDHLEEIIVVLALAIMSVIAFGNVITRNFLDFSIAFTEEVTINLFVLLTFVGAAIGVRKNAHLGFSLLYEISPVKIKKALTLIVGAITVFVFLTITYYGYDMAQFQMSISTKTPALGWPQWIFSMGLSFGALLCCFRAIQATVKEFLTIDTDRRES